MDKKANQSKGSPTPGSIDHDRHGTEFERVPGPGPNDAGRGAAGHTAKEQVELPTTRPSRVDDVLSAGDEDEPGGSGQSAPGPAKHT